MGDDDDDVVFLDEDEDWLDDPAGVGEEHVGGGQDPAMLPPRLAPSRLLLTLAALALFLAGTGTAFEAAYHRHLTDVRLANLLSLTAAAYPPRIPALADLGFASTWHSEIRERVIVPVVSRSPKPVVLLGAVLTEPGMVTPARLAPVGAATLKTGQTGELAGVVTVDCALPLAASPASTGGDPSIVMPKLATATLWVRAKTAGGRIAQTAVDPESGEGYGAEMQERICMQQGDNAIGPIRETAHYDPVGHVLTLGLRVESTADTALRYEATLSFLPHGGRVPPPCSVESVHSPTPPVGTLWPGAGLEKTFTIHTSDCPNAMQRQETQQLLLTVEVSINGMYVDAESALVPMEYS